MTTQTAVSIALSVTITSLVWGAILLLFRRQTPEGERRRTVLSPVFILLIVAILMNGFGLLGISAVASDTHMIAEDTKEAVEFVREQTSPERQTEQENTLNIVLEAIDCNAANRLQVGFDSLAAQGLIKPIDVLGDCARQAP